MHNLKVILEIDELAGCEIKQGRKTLLWENLSRKEQVQIVNTLANFCNLFYKHLKPEEGGEE